MHTSVVLSLYSDIVKWCSRLVVDRYADSQLPLSKYFVY